MSMMTKIREMWRGFRDPNAPPEHHGHDVAETVEDTLHAKGTRGSETGEAADRAALAADEYDDSFER